MASALWSLRGEVHEFETFLEGIQVQFSDNYNPVTIEIWTAIAFAETPPLNPFQWDQRERLPSYLIYPDSLISIFVFVFCPILFFFFFALPTDPISGEREGDGKRNILLEWP